MMIEWYEAVTIIVFMAGTLWVALKLVEVSGVDEPEYLGEIDSDSDSDAFMEKWGIYKDMYDKASAIVDYRTPEQIHLDDRADLDEKRANILDKQPKTIQELLPYFTNPELEVLADILAIKEKTYKSQITRLKKKCG